MTLQALRERIGSRDFFAVLRRWAAEQREGTVSTTDFMALAETGVRAAPREPVRRLAVRRSAPRRLLKTAPVEAVRNGSVRFHGSDVSNSLRPE